MFSIVYGIVVVASSMMGIGGFSFYIIFAIFLITVQYMIGPKMVEMSMKVRYVTEPEYPDIHRMVSDLSIKAGIPKPKIGISELPLPNAFAFGRWKNDGRVCLTKQIIKLLDNEELQAVIGHEICHLKNRDVTVITMLSVVPMALWFMAWSLMWSGGRRGNTVAIGLAAFLLYFITNLIVLYGSRIREYYADQGSIKLGNPPHALASALYKLVYSSAKVNKKSLKQMEGYKAFFVNDPSRARNEIRELKDIDTDLSGSIEQGELLALRAKEMEISTGDKFMEALSTHPNMIKRIKQLSLYK
jgi:heat shock protein HtpX|tara:strand:+ start:2192 stop:3094 length:903 start_codon:yes stop_codon:yes gene_type:complete